MSRAPLLRLATALAAVAVVAGCATTEPGHDDAVKGPPPNNPFEAMKDLPQGTPVPYAELGPGMCSNHYGQVSADQKVGTVDCADPHVFEIVSSSVLPDPKGAPFPGDRALAERLRVACQSVLDPVAAGAPGSRIRLHFMAYDQRSWDAGNRTGHCAITYTKPTPGKVGAATPAAS
ncbi:septum formation family protein [Streptomyces lavendulocolor]|uniref:septum formation family protein n=1 Tax=Streptomyces lavendulocolor TaxID=67316 RepID=UPI0033FBE0CB